MKYSCCIITPCSVCRGAVKQLVSSVCLSLKVTSPSPTSAEIVVVVNRIACSFPGYFYVKLPLKDNNVITCMLVQSGMCQLYLYSSALQPQIETLEIRRWLRMVCSMYFKSPMCMDLCTPLRN